MAVTKRRRKLKPYQAEVWVSGVMVESQAFDTKAQAHTWHDRTKAAYLRGEGSVSSQAETLTFAELIDHYEAQRLPTLLHTGTRAIPPQLKLFRASGLAAKRVRSITARDISEFFKWAKLQPTVDNPNRQSFEAEMKRLRILFTHFREEFDAKFVSPVLKKHTTELRLRPKRDQSDKYIPLEVVPDFLEGLSRCRNPAYYDIALVMLVFGLRIGEVAALKWDAVDLGEQTLRVKRLLEWRGPEGDRAGRKIVDRVKTESSRRTLPIPEIAAEAFLRARARHPTSEEVFLSKKGELLQDQNVVQVFNRVLAKLGVKWTGSHLLRHTNATLPLLAGMPLEQIQANLGHTSREQTETYAKVLSIVRNKVPATAANLISEAPEKKSRTLSRTQ